MGRQEKPLDPADGPAQQFAFELRKLRQQAGGITYRAMAARTPYSAATLAQAASGVKLPSLPVALAYVAVCGGDGGEWEVRWQQAAAEDLAEAPDDDGVAPPYMGLRRFQPQDRKLFFGRDQLTADLTALVRARRFAAVVGASGSGKSSTAVSQHLAKLRLAGLVDTRREGRHIHYRHSDGHLRHAWSWKRSATRTTG